MDCIRREDWDTDTNTELNRGSYMEYLIDDMLTLICVGIPMGTDCAPLLANLLQVQVHERVDKEQYIDGQRVQ